MKANVPRVRGLTGGIAILGFEDEDEDEDVGAWCCPLERLWMTGLFPPPQTLYPSHTLPVDKHFRHDGHASSHFTLRILDDEDL